MTLHLIALDRLVRSRSNARKTPSGGIDDLAASIITHGLLQNLLVLPLDSPSPDAAITDGRFQVIAGSRRLAALKKLARAKKIPRRHPVPCEIIDGHDPIEISLAENVVRVPMHPADEFAAFRSLAEAGHRPEAIAARFGVTAAVVKQRLKLAAISPTLMAEYRAGGIDLDQLMALTLSDDHVAQERAWHEAPDWDRHPARLRAILTKAAVQAGDRRVRFIGLAAYIAAGGGVIRDLFQEDHQGYLSNPALLDRLVAGKMQQQADAVRSEGWKWVEIRGDLSDTWQWRRLDRRMLEGDADAQSEGDEAGGWPIGPVSDGEQTDDVEREEAGAIAEHDDRPDTPRAPWTAEEMAGAGAVLSLGYDGRLWIERGLVRPGDDAPGDDVAGSEDAGARSSGDDNARRRQRPESDRLIEDLTAQKTAALQAIVGADPDAALLVAVHALTLPLFDIGSAYQTCLTVSVVPEELSRHAETIASTPAMTVVADRHRTWAERLPVDPADLWDWLASQPRAVRLELFAHCIGLLIHGVHLPNAGADRMLAADRLAAIVALDMAAWWQPTKDSYLARVPKARILDVVAEAVSPEDAATLAGLKKAKLVETAEQLLQGRRWLPAVLQLPASREQTADEA